MCMIPYSEHEPHHHTYVSIRICLEKNIRRTYDMMRTNDGKSLLPTSSSVGSLNAGDVCVVVRSFSPLLLLLLLHSVCVCVCSFLWELSRCPRCSLSRPKTLAALSFVWIDTILSAVAIRDRNVHACLSVRVSVCVQSEDETVR